MLVSLVMAAFNRPHLLELGLWSLRRFHYKFDLEIIVVNDGTVDGTEEVCKKYGAKYFFTGHRNAGGSIYRVPAFAINFGVKQAKGEILTLSCPEIFHLEPVLVIEIRELLKKGVKQIVTPRYMYFDDSGKETKSLLENKTALDKTKEFLFSDKGYEAVQMPFLMTIYKKEFISIGGYDEDFTGYACDDNDFVDRLVANGLVYNKCPGRIMHLYHGVTCDSQLHPENEAWKHNYDLYQARKGTINRNCNREWGKG